MRTGEYLGVNNVKYRWVLLVTPGIDRSYEHQEEWLGSWKQCPIVPANWPDAKKALDDLIAEEAEGWIECHKEGMFKLRWRVRDDGILQMQDWSPSNGWIPASPVVFYLGKAMFEAGRETALEDERGLADMILRWDNGSGDVAWEHVVDEARRFKR